MKRSFTLLELLIVLFVLAAVAASAASLVVDADDQLRFEDTRSRLEQVRRATVGAGDGIDPRAAGAAGFVADLGRLPLSLTELLQRDLPAVEALPAYTLPEHTRDAATGVAYGWRGPYLQAFPGLVSGALEFRDGWGNARLSPPDPPRNFGWVVAQAGLDWTVRSRGRDGAAGGVALYDQDYPAGPLVRREDCFLDLATWTQVRVVVRNAGAARTEDLRLRLHFPEDAALTSADSAELTAVALAPGDTELLFAFPAVERWVAAGRRTLEVVHENPAGSGAFVRLGPAAPQAVDLVPRAPFPATLPGVWSLP